MIHTNKVLPVLTQSTNKCSPTNIVQAISNNDTNQHYNMVQKQLLLSINITFKGKLSLKLKSSINITFKGKQSLKLKSSINITNVPKPHIEYKNKSLTRQQYVLLLNEAAPIGNIIPSCRIKWTNHQIKSINTMRTKSITLLTPHTVTKLITFQSKFIFTDYESTYHRHIECSPQHKWTCLSTDSFNPNTNCVTYHITESTMHPNTLYN